MNLDVFDCKKDKVGSLDLKPEVFEKEMNRHLLHEVVRMQLANRRQGTASTKTRSMVRGGGRKPWKQKGTGRARAGTSSSPLWVGGGTVFGPHPRSYEIKLPKKVKKSALRVALSSKVKAGELFVVEKLSFERPRTKDMVSLLGDFGLTGTVLVVTEGDGGFALKSANNLKNVDVLNSCGLNVMDVLKHDFLLVEKDALKAVEGRLS